MSRWQGERRRARQLIPQMLAKIGGKVVIDVLVSDLAILRISRNNFHKRATVLQVEVAASQTANFIGPQARLNRQPIDQLTLRCGRLLVIHAAVRRLHQPRPFVGQEHTTLSSSVGLGVRFAERRKRIASQFVVVGEPLRKRLDRR
nr:hypothetical protein [Roseimaritima ulvae]